MDGIVNADVELPEGGCMPCGILCAGPDIRYDIAEEGARGMQESYIGASREGG